MTHLTASTSSVSSLSQPLEGNRMRQLRTIFAVAGFVVVLLLVALGHPAPAAGAIDMSGVYEAIQFPRRYTFVQTDTDLQVSGPYTFANKPLSATGTIDPDTGQSALTGEVTGRCTSFALTGTGDGEMFTTVTCDDFTGAVTATKCLSGMIDPGEDRQDGNFLDGDCCSSGCRLDPSGSACTSDGNVCTETRREEPGGFA